MVVLKTLIIIVLKSAELIIQPVLTKGRNHEKQSSW